MNCILKKVHSYKAPMACRCSATVERLPTAIEVMLGRVLVDALQERFDYLTKWAKEEKIGMHNGVPVVWLDTVALSATERRLLEQALPFLRGHVQAGEMVKAIEDHLGIIDTADSGIDHG